MRRTALWLLALVIGAGVGICVATDVRAEPSLRYVTVKSGDWVKVKGQHLECNVAPDSIYCVETGGFPRLSFLATTTPGKGEFYIHRWQWFGDQAATVAEVPRRK